MTINAHRWRRALVTGASEGIGRALCFGLSKLSCDLVLVARREAPLCALASELERNCSIRCEVLPADLTVPAELAKVEARLALGDVDLLINNAGGGRVAGFTQLSDRQVEREVLLNVVAPTRLAHVALRTMSRPGNIVFMSSGIGHYPAPFCATYAASKAFLNSLGSAIRAEQEGNSAIGVTTVCPGFTRTGALERSGMNVSRLLPALWTSPQRVAQLTLEAADKNLATIFPGFTAKLSRSLALVLPGPVLLPLMAGLARFVQADDAVRNEIWLEDGESGTAAAVRRSTQK